MNRKARKIQKLSPSKEDRKALKRQQRERKSQLRKEFSNAMNVEIQKIKAQAEDEKSIKKATKRAQRAIRRAFKQKGM